MPTDLDFAKFLQVRAPMLVTVVSAMKSVLEMRNQATHSNLDFELATVRKMSAACRTILDSLHARRKSV